MQKEIPSFSLRENADFLFHAPKLEEIEYLVKDKDHNDNKKGTAKIYGIVSPSDKIVGVLIEKADRRYFLNNKRVSVDLSKRYDKRGEDIIAESIDKLCGIYELDQPSDYRKTSPLIRAGSYRCLDSFIRVFYNGINVKKIVDAPNTETVDFYIYIDDFVIKVPKNKEKFICCNGKIDVAQRAISDFL